MIAARPATSTGSAASGAAPTSTAATAATGRSTAASAAATIHTGHGAGIGTEAAGNRTGSEAAQAEAVARAVAHAGRETYSSRVVPHTGGKERWVFSAAARGHVALAAGFIVAGGCESAAGAALDHHRFFIGAGGGGTCWSRGCGRERLLAFIGSLDRRVLESGTRLTLTSGSVAPLRVWLGAGGLRLVGRFGCRLIGSFRRGRRGHGGRRCVGWSCRAIAGRRWRWRGYRPHGRSRRIADARHLHGPFMSAVFVTGNEDRLGGEPQDIDRNLPMPGRQYKRVLSRVVGVGQKFDGSLARGYGCAGNEMVGGSDSSALHPGGQLERTGEQYEKGEK